MTTYYCYPCRIGISLNIKSFCSIPNHDLNISTISSYTLNTILTLLTVTHKYTPYRGWLTTHISMNVYSCLSVLTFHTLSYFIGDIGYIFRHRDIKPVVL